MIKYGKKIRKWKLEMGDGKMKSAGIRRIDDLGRVVIPKEMRNRLHIRNGDTVEIFTNSEGEVIIKKYSPVSELSNFSQQYVDAIFEYIKLPMLVCDFDHVISVSGVSHKEYLEHQITLELVECMQDRKSFISNGKSEFRPVDGEELFATVICPIIACSIVVGAVVLLQNKNNKVPDLTEIMMVKVAASFLGKQMEE